MKLIKVENYLDDMKFFNNQKCNNYINLDKLKDLKGIYLFFDYKENRVKYLGESNNLKKRIAQDLRENFLSENFRWSYCKKNNTSYSQYMKYHKNNLILYCIDLQMGRKEIHEILLEILKPEYNS